MLLPPAVARKIAAALCAITCCITLLYRVRMPAPHYASSAVIHVSCLCAPFRNKQSMQTRRETFIRKKKPSYCSGRSLFLNYNLFVESARKMDIRQFMKSISVSRNVENIQDKRLRLRFNQHRLMG